MMVFRRTLALILAVLSLQVSAAGQTLPEKSAASENLWPGFGKGSLRQGDVDFARKCRTAEITGLALTGAGALGIAATAFTRDILLAVNGRTTTADYYICGAMIAAGIGTFTVSRIVAYRRAGKIEAGLVPLPAASGGGAGLVLAISF